MSFSSVQFCEPDKRFARLSLLDSFTVHYHHRSFITQSHYSQNEPRFFKTWQTSLQALIDPEWSQQKHNINSGTGWIFHLQSTHIHWKHNRLIREKKRPNFLLLPLQDTIIKGVFRYASSDLDWGQWEGRGNILCSEAWVTFSARRVTLDLSDFLFFLFLGFLMKRDGGEGDMKGGVKGMEGGVEDKRKGPTAIAEVSRWKDGEMVSLFCCDVPLRWVLVMQSTVSTETGARKQHDHLAGGASKEQPSPHLCTTMCVAVYEGIVWYFSNSQQNECTGCKGMPQTESLAI